MLAASRAPKAVGRSRICCSANKPTYPFGYGLSHSTFQYSNLHVERVSYAPGEPVIVSVDLQNSGTRTADEGGSALHPSTPYQQVDGGPMDCIYQYSDRYMTSAT